MVSELSFGPNVRGFKPDRDDGLRAIKICSTPSFGGKVKPSAPCREILRRVKNHFEVWTKIFRRPNESLPSPSSFDLLLDDC
jgi:hypothetical protein